MDEVEQAVAAQAQRLGEADVESRVDALQQLTSTLKNAVKQQDGQGQASSATLSSHTLQNLVNQLRPALKTANERVHAAALTCTRQLFQYLTPTKDGSHTAAAHHHHIQHDLRHAVEHLIPPYGVLHYLGDSKESVRELAGGALLAAGRAAATVAALSTSRDSIGGTVHATPDSSLAILDRLVKEQGFASKNPRAREQSLLYLTRLRTEFPTLPLRQWVAILVSLLEDQDGIVRDLARESTITIFTMHNVGPTAKSDLRKELMRQGVRRTTSEAVLKGVLGASQATGIPTPSTGIPVARSRTSSADGESLNGGSRRSSSISIGRQTPQLRNPSGTLQRSPSTSLIPQTGTSKPVTRGDRLLKKPKDMTTEEILANIEAQAAAAPPPPPTEESTLQTVYIASTRDLEQEFDAMKPCFEGKESEHNWQQREKSIYKIRGMLLSDAHLHFNEAFIAALKRAADWILKALATLRTTLASATCALISELARAMRHTLDPLFETLFSALVKMASLTKKTIAQQSQDAADELIRNCSFHHRSLSILSNSLEQKNVQGRQYTASHIKLLIATFAPNHAHLFEGFHCLDTIYNIIKLELADANGGVRDTGRATYWVVRDIWPDLARQISDSLDTNNRKLLEKSDPKNIATASGAPTGRTVSGSSAASTSRPSMRALINSRRAAQSATAVPSVTDAEQSVQDERPDFGRSATTPTTSRRISTASSGLPTPAALTPQRRPSSSLLTSRQRPASFYGTSSSPRPSLSQSISRSTLTPRDRTPSYGSATAASSSQTPSPYRGSPQLTRSMPPGSATPDRAGQTTPSPSKTRISSHPSQSAKSPSPASKPLPPSPTLMAIADQDDFSVFDDGFTMDNIANTVPLHNEMSSYDESLLNHFAAIDDSRANDTTVLVGSKATAAREQDDVTEDDNNMSRLLEQMRLDEAMIDGTTQDGLGLEAEEEVKGRAEQAEQTAHRFLELTEPDDQDGDTSAQVGDVLDESDGGEVTIIHHASDINTLPVEQESNLATNASILSGLALSEKPLEIPSAQSTVPAVTPMLRRIREAHLQDSPAAGSPKIIKSNKAEESWWTIKADFQLSRIPSLDLASLQLADTVEDLVQKIESGTQSENDLLELAKFSQDVPFSGADDQEAKHAVQHTWQERQLFSRCLDGAVSLLVRDQEDQYTEPALMLLKNLVAHQNDLLGGRELDVAELLLELRSWSSKGTTAAAEVINAILLDKAEPLFALSTLRTSLTAYLAKQGVSEALPSSPATPLTAGASYAWAMGMKSFADLFVELPAEVLEEELAKCKDLVQGALNNQAYPHLRQAAMSAIVKAHTVLQDDARLFDILGGLTKSQIHLCTYLFAKEEGK